MAEVAVIAHQAVISGLRSDQIFELQGIIGRALDHKLVLMLTKGAQLLRQNRIARAQVPTAREAQRLLGRLIVLLDEHAVGDVDALGKARALMQEAPWLRARLRHALAATPQDAPREAFIEYLRRVRKEVPRMKDYLHACVIVQSLDGEGKIEGPAEMRPIVSGRRNEVPIEFVASLIRDLRHELLGVSDMQLARLLAVLADSSLPAARSWIAQCDRQSAES